MRVAMISLIRRAPRSAGLALTACASLAACGGKAGQEPAATPAPAPAADAPPAAAARPMYGSFGFDAAGMDRSVAAGDSFYRFANGTWHDKVEIPADRSSFGMFTRLAEEASRHTRELIEGASAGNSPEAKKIADAYAAYMDEAAIEAKGMTPLQPELDAIAAIKDRGQLAAALGATMRADVDPLNNGDVYTDRLFGVWIAEDLNEPTRYAAYLLQGGLGLPDRDYYIEDNPRFVEIRGKYQKHIAAVFGLARLSDAEARARRVFALETKIARAHWKQVDTREISKTNNPWPRDSFGRKARGLDWKRFFEAAGLAGQDQIMVWQPSALSGVARLVGSQPLQAWKDYLAYHAIERAAPFLSRAFVDQSFALYGTLLSGTQRLPERWKRAVDFASEAMGEAVGKLYVEKYFPPEAKAEADRMVKNIVAAFGQRIDGLTWMSPATKAKAKEKLGTLQVGIGHPAKWRDYSALEMARDDAFGNAERAARFEYQRNLAKLGQPVDRSEWFLVPQVVNALNSPQQNSMIFPAAILQPPFFDPSADPAVNYGGIGSVIGHEISHSFDDVGAQFDASGKLANWWTAEDMARFKAAGKQLVDQYNTYKPFPDLAVNGELTLGENIADVAGVAIAYDGYRLSLGGAEAPVLDGFTGDQRFYLGFAQVWRRKYREQVLRQVITTDGHSPSEYRAAAVRNQDAWYTAFDVKPGQALYLAPDQRVHVW
jgi:putative endopeptidase